MVASIEPAVTSPWPWIDLVHCCRSAISSSRSDMSVSPTQRSVASPGGKGCSLISGRLDVEDNPRAIRHHEAAGCQRNVPELQDSEVAPLYLRGSRETEPFLVPRVSDDAVQRQVEGDRPGDAVDGQVTFECIPAC